MPNLQFAIDKATNDIHEGIALLKIEEWYRLQGLKVHARYNEENGLRAMRGFDLWDSYGKKWEVKFDRLSGTTGNFFLEHQALDHSQADYFMLFVCGLTFVLPREGLLELRNDDYRVVQGGDDLRATGTLVPVSVLQELADLV